MQIHNFRTNCLLISLLLGLTACGGGNSSADDDSSTDSAPTADAGSDQSVASGDTVELTVTVTDDKTTTVSWSQTAGTTVDLSSTTDVTVSFTAPTVDGAQTLEFVVTVSDSVNPEVTDSITVTVNEIAELGSAFEAFGDNVSVVIDGSEVVFEATGRPDHRSCYWNPDNASGLYVDCDPDITQTAQMSPGFIEEYNNLFTLRAPLNPEQATSSSATGLGAVGIATSGVPIFNDQEGPNIDLELRVIQGFDRNGAHTGPQTYHYHLEPKAITNDDIELVGIIADGFLLYGRRCDSTGSYPEDLDASGGHVSFTQHTGSQDGDESYHYHIMNDLYLGAYYLMFPGDYQGTPNSIGG